MNNPNCKTCSKKEYKTIDNCQKFVADDGLTARCAPPWTSQKHKPIGVYSEMITEGMKNKWREINYIDLYAGPGKYFDRTSGILMDGSPLIASKLKFDNLYLNDIKKENVDALEKRLDGSGANLHLFCDDANAVAGKINSLLLGNSLSFCLLDPNNMSDLNFDTVRAISANKKKVDLMINFAYGMDFQRFSRNKKFEKKQGKIDLFFPSNEWRQIEDSHQKRKIQFRAEKLIDFYTSGLYRLGYERPPEETKYKNYFEIHNTRNGNLYYLIFASKHKRGYDFCAKMRPYGKNQTELDFN